MRKGRKGRSRVDGGFSTLLFIYYVYVKSIGRRVEKKSDFIEQKIRLQPIFIESLLPFYPLFILLINKRINLKFELSI